MMLHVKTEKTKRLKMNCPKCKCIMLGLECDNCGYVQKKDLIDTIIEIKNISFFIETPPF